MHYTPPMHQCLALKFLLHALDESCECVTEEHKKIEKQISEIHQSLTNEQIRFIDNRLPKLTDNYYNSVQEEIYYQEEHFGRDGFPRNQVTINESFYEIWKQGVKEKRTVWLKYDSVSSGISEREVDPYKSKRPYGEGFCHNRQEVRKFRFDRVINIKLTEKKFIKYTLS